MDIARASWAATRQTVTTALASVRGTRSRIIWQTPPDGNKALQEESYTTSEVKAARDLSLVTFSNDAASVYLILRNEKQLVTADQDMLTLLNRIALYKHRSTLVFEGTDYVLGDFAVKICRTILKPGEEVKGVAMDIEYMPASDAAAAHPALLEFMAALQEASNEPLSDMSVVETAIAEYGLSDTDITQQTAILYHTCASALLQVGQHQFSSAAIPAKAVFADIFAQASLQSAAGKEFCLLTWSNDRPYGMYVTDEHMNF